jgi:hypothetical protein
VIPAFLPDIPSISGDTVALLAPIVNPQAGFTAILIGNGGPLTPVVKTGDTVPVIATVSQTMQPSISGSTVAFWASRESSFPQPPRAGIFVRRGDGPIEKVIVEGESLFGSTVTGLWLGPFNLDAGGSRNLAFHYNLADGREGVALSYIIPEPTALMLTALVVVFTTAMRTRRCRRQSGEFTCL